MLTTIALTLLAFTLLWVGAGLAIKGITNISHSFKLSSFTVSFFILGIFTSMTEILVGVSALLENKPEIYVGNLLGSSAVVFLVVLPFLAIAGNGVKISRNLSVTDISKIILVAFIPALLTFDNTFSVLDAIIAVLSYFAGAFIISTKSNLFEKISHKDVSLKTLVFNLITILTALALVFLGSHLLVDQIPNIGKLFKLSPFVISILIVSLGTNVPELSIAVRSIFNKHKEIAIGTYLGSALVNTLEIGVLTLINGNGVLAEGSNFSIAIFGIGLLLFLIFIKSKHELSRKEGILLVIIYLLFAFLELNTGPGWVI